uniref:Uncharacterized protein n=1 Tax=Anopheles farauti TaxID=69004 RepID=A0A182QM52_9DIPT
MEENGGVSLSDRICRMRTSSYAMVKMLFLSAILFRLPFVWSSEFIAMPESWSSSSVDTLRVFALAVLATVVPLPPACDGFGGGAAGTGAGADESTILICTLLSRLTIGGVSGRASFGGLVRGAGSGFAAFPAVASASGFLRLPPPPVVMVVVELVVVVVSRVVPGGCCSPPVRFLPSRFSSESDSLPSW